MVVKGCGRLLAECESAAYGDREHPPYYEDRRDYYQKGFWHREDGYRCGCSNYDDKDNLPPEQRTDWILCLECAVKWGFRW